MRARCRMAFALAAGISIRRSAKLSAHDIAGRDTAPRTRHRPPLQCRPRPAATPLMAASGLRRHADIGRFTTVTPRLHSPTPPKRTARRLDAPQIIGRHDAAAPSTALLPLTRRRWRRNTIHYATHAAPCAGFGRQMLFIRYALPTTSMPHGPALRCAHAAQAPRMLLLADKMWAG